MMFTRQLVAAPILALMVMARIAHAGLFDDDEARKRVESLKVQTEERLNRLETAQRGQVDLANQIDALRNDIARLRGQVEVLTHNLESAQQRQQDFYVDLDTRLRKIEEAKTETVKAGKNDAPADPGREVQDYEAALNLFKANQYKDAAGAFEAFVANYPNAALAPSAQYWLGNSYQAAHDCRRAVDAQQIVIARWPEHVKAPDAFLNIATCQQEQGDAKGARKTLEGLVARYPQSGAAQTAKVRLQKK